MQDVSKESFWWAMVIFVVGYGGTIVLLALERCGHPGLLLLWAWVQCSLLYWAGRRTRVRWGHRETLWMAVTWALWTVRAVTLR